MIAKDRLALARIIPEVRIFAHSPPDYFGKIFALDEGLIRQGEEIHALHRELTVGS